MVRSTRNRWCPAAGALLALALPQLARASAAPEGQASPVLRPGETIRGEVEPGQHGRTRPFVARVEAASTGPLTIEAHSFEFDAFMQVFASESGGPASILVQRDEGGPGADARVILEVEAGRSYRVEVTPSVADENLACGSALTLTVTPGRTDILAADTPIESHRTHWQAAMKAAAESGVPACRVRALVGMAGTLDSMKSMTAFTEARRLAEDALAEARMHLANDPLAEAAALSILGRVLIDSAALAEARPRLERVLALTEQALGPDHPRVAHALRGLARLLREEGYPGEARPLLERGLKIIIREDGADGAETAGFLDDLGMCLREGHDFAGAQAAHERAVAILETRLGQDHPRTAGALINLAWDLAWQGLMWTRLPIYERVLAIYEKHYGPDHADLAIPLMFYGESLDYLGAGGAAEVALERAVFIQERALGPDHPRVAKSLLELGSHYGIAGQPERARSLLERSLSIREQALGSQHPAVADTLLQLGIRYRDMGSRPEQRALRELGKRHLERCVEIRRARFGADDVTVGMALTELGTASWWLGSFVGARQQLEQALAIKEKAWGAEHDSVALELWMLAEFLRSELDDNEAALPLALRALAIQRRTLRRTARDLPENEILGYARLSPQSLVVDILLRIASRRSASAAELRAVWDAIIRTRAIVLDEMAGRHHRVRATDPETVLLAAAFTAATSRYASVAIASRRSDYPHRFRDALDHAKKERDRAEQALAARAAVDSSHGGSEGGLDAVARRLPADAALVAVVRYTDRVASAEYPPSYGAFVLAGRDAEPAFVSLGPAQTIEALVAQWRADVAGDARGLASPPALRLAAYRETGERLRRAIWDPVVARLGAARRVYFVPDGALHLVNLLALPSATDRYLIETGPLISTLSVERDLVQGDVSPPAGSGALVLGGPDFDAPLDEIVLAAERPVRAAPDLPVFRSPRPSCARFLVDPLVPLEGAVAEAEEISALLRTSAPGRGTVVQLQGAGAQEGAFKKLAPGRRLLHLGTHGFFEQGECRSALDLPTAGEGGPASADNPLVLSGLALAGANRRDEADLTGEREDGILTAEEIAALDLSAVELTVLSACETGLGAFQTGEGVLGLRRAFAIAGVKSLVMSLWRVEDQVAREWMLTFYAAHLSGLSAVDSAALASRAMLDARRNAGATTHPSSWGAFIAIGG